MDISHDPAIGNMLFSKKIGIWTHDLVDWQVCCVYMDVVPWLYLFMSCLGVVFEMVKITTKYAFSH